MMMHKAEKTAVVLLLVALGTLAVANWAFPADDTPSSSDQDARTSVEGTVLKVTPTKTGGHLILRLDSTPLSIFIPREAGAASVQSTVQTGARVRVVGELADFGEDKEIKVSRAEDVEVLGS
jgi:hypothetical protein